MSDIVAFSPVRALDGSGRFVSGALALFFETGTTTPVTVYSDAAQTTPHPAPLVADSTGTFPAVFHSGVALKVSVTAPGGALLPGYPIDPALVVPSAGNAAGQISFIPTSGIPETNVQDAIEAVQAQVASASLVAGAGLLRTGDTFAITGQGLALHNLAVSGMVARTGAGTVAARTIAGTAPVTVANGDGVAGNPTIDVTGLTQGQAEDSASTVFGIVSGERLGQAIAAQATSGSFEVFTADGTFTVPAGVTQVLVTVIGGGGAGGGVASGAGRAGAGGGSGAVAHGAHTVTPAAAIAVTVGAGGTAETSTGNPGGNSTFGSVVTSAGGAGGPGNNGGVTAGGAGGALTSTLTLPLYQIAGGTGGGGDGAGGIAGTGGTVPNWPAVGIEGVGGAPPAINANGNPGGRFGAGGSGTKRDAPGSNTGGVGAPGIVIVRW